MTATLQEELTEIRDQIARVTRSDDLLLQVLNSALDSGDAERLEAAKATFDALPESECNAIRNGWPRLPANIDQQRDQLIMCDFHKPVRHFLEVNVREDKDSDDGWRATARFTTALRSNNAMVRIQILHGTNKAIASTMLHQIANDLDDIMRVHAPNKSEDIIPF